MKLILSLLFVFSITSSFACSCAYQTIEEVVNEAAFIVEAEVMLSEDNKTLLQVQSILKETEGQYYYHAKKQLMNQYTNREGNRRGIRRGWFVANGTEGFGSCSGVNVELPIGTKVFLVAEVNEEGDYKKIINMNFRQGSCSYSSNYFVEGSHSYKGIKKILNL